MTSSQNESNSGLFLAVSSTVLAFFSWASWSRKVTSSVSPLILTPNTRLLSFRNTPLIRIISP